MNSKKMNIIVGNILFSWLLNIYRSINVEVFFARVFIQIQCGRADVDTRSMHELKVSVLDKHQHQHKCTGFGSFLEQQDLRMY